MYPVQPRHALTLLKVPRPGEAYLWGTETRESTMRRWTLMAAAVWWLAVLPAHAGEQILIDGKPWIYDADDARDIMRTCAACHGEGGAGGGGGVYPRLAGLNPDYIAKQLREFKSRQRENIPMVPYATERELPERDVLTIARYLSELKVETHLPADLPSDGFARLEAMKRVLQIPREPGDIAAGQDFYDSACAVCHGHRGEGRLMKPQLAGQHIKYLKAQVDGYLTGRRSHDDLAYWRTRSEADWANLWAYVSTFQE